MTSSATEARAPLAQRVVVTNDTLQVDLLDGRSLSVPLSWYPRLAQGSETERQHWQLIGRGEGIHWPELDEDISVANLLARLPSAETQESLKRWLSSRRAL